MSKNINGLESLSEFGQYLHYLKWRDDLGRYETWEEAVDDVMEIHKEFYKDNPHKPFENPTFNYLFEETKRLYKEKRILGSQRILQMRRAVLKHNLKVYNCITMYGSKFTFFEHYMYALLCGCGVGVSIQNEHTQDFGYLCEPDKTTSSLYGEVHVIEDSIEGWAKAVQRLINSYFISSFTYPVFDYTHIRPEGSYITGGFKAPGYQPLQNAITKIDNLLSEAVANGQQKLTNIQIYDIAMFIADAVISGGVRRSATIFLFSPEDEEMMKSKTGNWFIENPQRGRSNNSVVLLKDSLTKEDLTSYIENTKQFGEPGIVLTDSVDFVYNPCVEIGMMPSLEENGKLYHTMQGCNLTEINGKLNSTVDELLEATTCASFLGTLQAGYTKFYNYLPESYSRTFEKEALIGVSITGWFNNPTLLADSNLQQTLAENVKYINTLVAEKLGINPAARTTCVKPSGNASVVLQTSSGVTPEHAPRYFRGVQVNKLHAIGDLYKRLNPKAVEESVWSSTNSDYYVVFPVEVEGAIYKDDVSAVEHLEHIKTIQQNWIEYGTNFDRTRHEKLRHNVSNTVTVQEGEWDSVIDYIFENRQFFTGLSLLSGSGDRDYQQAPFTKVLNEIELVEEYGSAAIFASGLIVDALHVFNDLWEAIRYVDSIDNIKESLYDMIESEVSDEDRTKMFAKFDWIKRFNKFANNYFNGDTYKTGLCLKDCHNFHRWVAITRNYKQVSWAAVLPRPNYTAVDTLAATACHGDSCVINLG